MEENGNPYTTTEWFQDRYGPMPEDTATEHKALNPGTWVAIKHGATYADGIELPKRYVGEQVSILSGPDNVGDYRIKRMDGGILYVHYHDIVEVAPSLEQITSLTRSVQNLSSEVVRLTNELQYAKEEAAEDALRAAFRLIDNEMNPSQITDVSTTEELPGLKKAERIIADMLVGGF